MTPQPALVLLAEIVHLYHELQSIRVISGHPRRRDRARYDDLVRRIRAAADRYTALTGH